MNLRDLRYVLAVAEHGHFGRAAEACGVSQPTLSVQLRKLEELLGVALFERSSKAVTPTAACARLIGHVRAAEPFFTTKGCLLYTSDAADEL